MRRAAWFGFVLLAGFVVGSSAAVAQIPDPDQVVSDVIDTVTSTADEVVGTVEDTLDSTADTASGAGGTSGTSSSDLGSSLGSIATGGSGSTSGSSASSTGGSGSSAGSSSPTSSRQRAAVNSGRTTRFDRLPQRLERLLERIMLGRNFKANLRRLERLLASASPELRRRVARLVRSEIRRLERGGVTRQERRRIERLERVLDKLAQPRSAPTTNSPARSGGPMLIEAGRAGTTAAGGERRGGVLGTRTSNTTVGGEEPQARPIPIPSPERPGGFPPALGLLLLALLALGLVGLVAAVTNHVLERPRSGFDI